jgi:hypothetical protein
MGCHTRAPESPRSHFGGGAGGEGNPAYAKAPNRIFAQMFCPPLNKRGRGCGRSFMRLRRMPPLRYEDARKCEQAVGSI